MYLCVGEGQIALKTRNVEAVKFLWKRKQFEERSWKRKQTWKLLTFWGAGSIFHKTWGRSVEARLNFCGRGSTLKKEAGSENKLGSD